MPAREPDGNGDIKDLTQSSKIFLVFMDNAGLSTGHARANQRPWMLGH
jgi:acetamidase/formamidase